MSDFFIRLATPQDGEEAALLLQQSITQLCVVDHQNDPTTLARWLENKTPQHFQGWLDDSESRLVVASDPSGLLGVGALHRSAVIRLCYVRPDIPRSGIGSALVSALEVFATEWGLRSLSLQSTLTARSFYERRGFVPTGDPIQVFGVLRAFPYAKSLSP